MSKCRKCTKTVIMQIEPKAFPAQFRQPKKLGTLALPNFGHLISATRGVLNNFESILRQHNFGIIPSFGIISALLRESGAA